MGLPKWLLGKSVVPVIIGVALILPPAVPRAAGQAVFVNEFLASNSLGIVDEDGDPSDWIELYNAESVEVNLLGYGLTDDASNPFRWVFPSVTIPAKGFLLIWASGKDRIGPPLHTNFALDRDGEFVGLYAPGGAQVDGRPFGTQTPDVSHGRRPDGGAEWVYFPSPTPGATNSTNPLAPPPLFSLPGGYYTTAQTLIISSTATGATIRYTTDSSDPDEWSPVYTAPLSITGSQVVRARVYTPTDDPSPIVSATYLFADPGSMATLSLVTDPDNLWDPVIGIYVNYNERGDAWERPVSVELMVGGTAVRRVDGGIRIHGGRGTRWCTKKSFRLYFDYGSRLEYPLFPQKPIESYQRLVLRAGGHDGPFHPSGGPIWTELRDPVMNELFRDAEPLTIGQRPAKVFLNGESWGIYWVAERIDQYFVEDNAGYNDFDLIKGSQPDTGAPLTELREGDMEHWEFMTDFLNSNDFSDPGNYAAAGRLIDLERKALHDAAEMWAGNWDWPHMNIYMLRPKGPVGLWRWIPWDSDVSLGALVHATNMYPHMVGAHDEREEWSTLHFRKLRHNTDFQHLFANSVADLLNTALKASHVSQVIDELAALMRPDISFETDRWGSSPADWESHVADMKTWATGREPLFWSQTEDFFGMSGQFSLSLMNPEGEGMVRVNSLHIRSFPWGGLYFDNVPVTLAALPAPGYTFSRWEGASLPAEPEVTLVATAAQTVWPVFEPITASPQPNDVIINEYWNNDDGTAYETLGGRTISGDWVELLVTASGGVDVRNWRLTNNDIKSGTQTEAGSVVFPPIPVLANLPQGTVVLVIADPEGDNAAQFATDDLDPSDGRLIFYVGNGNLDISTDKRFTIKNADDNLVLLAPGPSASFADDVGVDFVAEGYAVTPSSFGVASDGVVFINPFAGIGDDDGALFTTYSSGYNNDNGLDPVKDDQPGAGGWMVDPPAKFSGDAPEDPTSVMMLSPGALNPGQALGSFPTPTPTPVPSPTPGLNPSAAVLRWGTEGGGIQLYFAASDVCAYRDERPGAPAVGLSDRSEGAAWSYWAPGGSDTSPGYLDGTQCGSSGEVRDTVGSCSYQSRLSGSGGNLALTKPDLSGPGAVFNLSGYVSFISSADPRMPFDENSSAYPAWVKYSVRSPQLQGEPKAYVWFRCHKPSRQLSWEEDRTSDDSYWIVGSPEPLETDRSLFYLADDNDGPGDNDGPDRSGTPADILNGCGDARHGMEQWFWASGRIDPGSNLGADWCSSPGYKISCEGNRVIVLHMTRMNDGMGNGVLEFYLVGREPEFLQEAVRLDMICVSTVPPTAFVPSDESWDGALELAVGHWIIY